jgi:hypothetical protein
MFKRRGWAHGHGDHMDTFTETLAADRPFPGLEEELRTFGQFIGAWDVDLSILGPDGKAQRLRGEWHFGWALGGRAVVDVFDVPGRDHAIVVRVYDPDCHVWRVSYSGAVSRRLILLAGRQEGDEIVLEGEEDGTQLRWIFSEIAADSFTWRGFASTDSGRGWDLGLEMSVTRRGRTASRRSD